MSILHRTCLIQTDPVAAALHAAALPAAQPAAPGAASARPFLHSASAVPPPTHTPAAVSSRPHTFCLQWGVMPTHAVTRSVHKDLLQRVVLLLLWIGLLSEWLNKLVLEPQAAQWSTSVMLHCIGCHQGCAAGHRTKHTSCVLKASCCCRTLTCFCASAAVKADRPDCCCCCRLRCFSSRSLVTLSRFPRSRLLLPCS